MTMTEQTMELVRFADRDLMTVKKNATVYVALKPICEALEIEWEPQRKMVMKDDVLKSTTAVWEVVAADGKQREMLCLPLDYLNGWLFRIKASHFPASKRALIIRYQKECYRALAEHFQAGRAEAAVSAAVMEQALKCELNDRRLILKQLGGIMKIFWVDAACIARLATQAEEILVAWPDRPASVIPYEAWAEEGSEPDAKLMERAAVVGRNQVIGKKPRTLGC